ncbi:MAG: hypothetical protein IH965_13675 [Gemmatimonadetes bacterium]|nr:hypothetical protein [Gemmatimonadota bacterium]
MSDHRSALTSDRARELAAMSAAVRRAKAQQRLTLRRVEAELGSLETIEDAMRRVDRLGLWIAAGMLSGSSGGAAVRSVEVWLRGHESTLTRKVVDELTGEVERLKADLRRPKRV